MGNYQQALDAYQQALALNPNNQDASYNRDIVKKQLEQQQSKQQHSQQEQQQKSQENKQQQSQQQPTQDNQSENVLGNKLRTVAFLCCGEINCSGKETADI